MFADDYYSISHYVSRIFHECGECGFTSERFVPDEIGLDPAFIELEMRYTAADVGVHMQEMHKVLL